ncbi:hypothetical protein M011DRAFT_460088 [Sporormia fimetaria CBS 119925]|uniref:polynucleotide adenylyltransferase n=1 Tax=Sporormia fimetaria CBS 119925 TaxID=1340428 RepID=A0A6A6V706_9PLEO|nr:hypothetical protein M011DRAFT_460088 [Sporormia fimetaria CBS 119925]
MAGDSYRPQRPARSYRFTHGGGDNYRPERNDRDSGRNEQSFTFTAGNQGPRFPPQDRAPPTGPRNGGRRQNNNARRGPGPKPRRPFYKKPAPHERELLQAHNDGSPERTLGVTEGVNKFRDLDDLSASESDMDTGDSDDNASSKAGTDQEPSHKLARRETNAPDDGDSVPKWSNPDPYIVLPPPSETTGKRIDFVQLIRKAKNEAAEKTPVDDAVKGNDDFISFGDDETEAKDDLGGQNGIPPPPSEAPPLDLPPLPPPPPPPQRSDMPLRDKYLRGSMNDISQIVASSDAVVEASRRPPQAPVPAQRAPKRKRGQAEGGITGDWLPRPNRDPVPWCVNKRYKKNIEQKDANELDKMYMLLHNEILDFYEFVEPTEHDRAVRDDLIKRIEDVFARNRSVIPGLCKVEAFGSYPASLYLPTADMDLVLVSLAHLNGGSRLLNDKMCSKLLYTVRGKLQRAGICDRADVISRAKVPIIKFYDRLSQIKVDLSLENLSGVSARATFVAWTQKEEFLMSLVALVKQFLLMRDLNDVHTGGLGGFSIICLVYAFLRIQRVKGKLVQNVGKVFMGFLDFWGNQFNLATQRLDMSTDPPQIVYKDAIGIDGRPEKIDGLSIQDPNRSDNNISGGSHRAALVFKLFSEAHEALLARLQRPDFSGISILETIIGGNYETYERQKMIIANLRRPR